MSFYTSLTGLAAATASLGVTSNNIANVGTTGFKRSRADFGDIFATSPLQKASSVIGQGVALKQVTQEFSQGNIQFSANALDLAITGDGFFPLKSADGLQDIYTRNGTFLLDDSFAVVNSAGQFLQAASVDSSGKADLDTLRKLIIPRSTAGDARETTLVELALNLPADGQIIEVPFDRNDPATYNLTTAVTVFDAGGNEFLATVYYQKTKRATPDDPTNKWQTHVFIGDTKLDELLIQSTDDKGQVQYVNKYGEIRTETGNPPIPPQDIARGVTKLFNFDDLRDRQPSVPAVASGSPLTDGFVAQWKNGFNIPTQMQRVLADNPVPGVTNRSPIQFALNVDGSREPVTVDLSYLNEPGSSLSRTFTGVEMARELTNAINKAYGDERYFDFTSLKLSETASNINLFEITVSGADATPTAADRFVVSLSEQRTGANPDFGTFLNLNQITREEAIRAIQSQIDEKAFADGLIGANSLAIANFFSELNTEAQKNGTTSSNLVTLPTSAVGFEGVLNKKFREMLTADSIASGIASDAAAITRSERQQITFTAPSPAIAASATRTISVGGSEVVLTSADNASTTDALAAPTRIALKAQKALVNDRFGASAQVQTLGLSDAVAAGTATVAGVAGISILASDKAEAIATKIATALNGPTSNFTGERQEITLSGGGTGTPSVTVGGTVVPVGTGDAATQAAAILTGLAGLANHSVQYQRQMLSFTAPTTALVAPATATITVLGQTVTLDHTHDTPEAIAAEVVETLTAAQTGSTPALVGHQFRVVGDSVFVEYPGGTPPTLPTPPSGTPVVIPGGAPAGLGSSFKALVTIDYPASAGDAPLATLTDLGTSASVRTVRELNERTVADNGDGTLTITFGKDDGNAAALEVTQTPTGILANTAIGVTTRAYEEPIISVIDGSLRIQYLARDGDVSNLSFQDTTASGVNMSVATTREFQVTQSEQQTLTFSAPSVPIPTEGSIITVAGVSISLATDDNTPAKVATRVAQTLRADAFITAHPGRSVTDNLDGTITIEFALNDNNADEVVLIDTSATGIRLTSNQTREYINTEEFTDKQFAQSVAESVAPLQMAGKIAIDAKSTKQEVLKAIQDAAANQAVGNPYFNLVAPTLAAAQAEFARTSSTALSVYEAALAAANGAQRAAVEAYSSRSATKDTVLSAITGAQVAASSATTSFIGRVTALAAQSPQPTINVLREFVSEEAEGRTATANSDISRADSFRAVQVGYNPVVGSFTFNGREDDAIRLASASSGRNELFGLEIVPTTVNESGTYGSTFFPNGREILARAEQRYGIRVTFNDTDRTFEIASGTTGDTSTVKISDASELANILFGFTKESADRVIAAATGATPVVERSNVPLRGIESKPAVLTGNPIGINIDNKFAVDARNDTFVVTVDNVTSLIQMPRKPDYNIEEFRQQLEQRVNSMADSFGRTTNGVRVEIKTNPVNNTKFFEFTTGTQGDNSFLKISGPSVWGLSDLDSVRGETTRWIEPIQATDKDGFPLYVDRDGRETTDAADFSEDETRDLWIPIFLDKGELTFDTAGKIQSPLSAIKFRPETIGTSGSTLGISIDYAGSTQFSNPFSILAQNQNGRPEGDLIGLDIGDDGLVSANYSNGSQKNLAKIVLANFANPTGLRQIGDASFYATSKSGAVTLGEAGTAGYGTVRAGARERANVDLTAELIELITNQRNFQANAKAIETNNTLTQAIINIR